MNTLATIIASADEAEQISRDALSPTNQISWDTLKPLRDALGPGCLKPRMSLAERAAWERLRQARSFAHGIDRQLRSYAYASIWHCLEEERKDAWWEVRLCLSEIKRARYASKKMREFGT